MSQEFRIEKKGAFTVIGKRIHTTNQKKAGTRDVPKHWEAVKQQHIHEQLMTMMNQEPFGLFGMSVYNVDEADSRKFDHYIGVSSTMTQDGFVTYEVPASTWAIFPCTVETIGKTEAMAITKWLPKAHLKPRNSGYITGRMKSEAPDIEWYGEQGEVEVWVAIKDQK